MRAARRSARVAGVLAVLAGIPVVGLAGSLPAAMASGSPQAPSDGAPSSEGRPYPGDAEREAAFVSAEDERLIEVDTVRALATWGSSRLESPYRLRTGSAYTLVLTARKDPYTIDDLRELAPQTFVRQPDGAYLLSEHIVVESGAALNLADAGGLDLLMASDGDGFVSIVSDGGRLVIQGTTGAPASVTSHDRGSGRPDDDTSDGRAYIRTIGGQVSISHAEIGSLGFWSGRTGGLSFTGTDRPDHGALLDLDEVLDDANSAEAAEAAEPQVEGNRDSALGTVLPSGELPELDLGDGAGYSFVSASVTDTVVHDNAYGLFVSGANGLEVRDSRFADNLVSGLVMHRYVLNSTLEGTIAEGNGQDGIVLSRATTGIVLTEVTADGNARNGVTISGQPLAEGPSATGMSVQAYGNNSLANSSASGNGRYGIEVLGGRNVGVLGNDVDGNQTGIVVRDGAREVDVVGNQVGGSLAQGIALRDGVASATISGNLVSGGTTGVYLRDAVAEVSDNTLSGATSHAVTVVGDVGSTTITGNRLSGRGPSAIDSMRAVDLDRRTWSNDDAGWHDTTPFLVTLKRFLQPLTLMWTLLAAVLLFTAVRGARSRRTKQHPYAHQRPLAERAPVAVGAASTREPA